MIKQLGGGSGVGAGVGWDGTGWVGQGGRGDSAIFFLKAFSIGVNSLEFAPERSKFFPLRLDPLLEGFHCPG